MQVWTAICDVHLVTCHQVSAPRVPRSRSNGLVRLGALAALAISACNGVPPSLGGEPWPLADDLFHQDPKWLGGDLGSTIGSFRIPSGVIVAARAEAPQASPVSLSAGDVIHSVNGVPVSNLQELRAALDGLQPHSPVVLHVEREGVLTFVTFELE